MTATPTALAARQVATSGYALDVPFVDWPDLVTAVDWRQGEHVLALGPTGCGKSTLLLGLSDRRAYVVVAATKPRDATLERLIRSKRFHRTDRWPVPSSGREPLHPRVIFWPKISKAADEAGQQRAFYSFLAQIYDQGGWCVDLDELRYITQHLRLARPVELLWQQGRSIGVSVMAAIQRPAFIPLAAYDQSSHLFLWRETDKRNIDRIAEVSGGAAGEVRAALPGLGTYECLYVNTRTGAICRTRYRR